MLIDTRIARWDDAVELFDNERYEEAWRLLAGHQPTTPFQLRIAGMIRSRLDGRSQDEAKDLLTRSMVSATPLDVARSQVYLALCYWRAGEMQEALVCSEAPLEAGLTGDDMLRALLTRSVILRANGRLDEALSILLNCDALVRGASSILLGKLHNQRALSFHELGRISEAAGEYELAGFCFEACGNFSLEAVALNNVAGLFFNQGMFAKANANIDRAISLFAGLGDVRLGNALDQRAQIQLAEGSFASAERSARAAVLKLEGGDPDFHAKALITHGRALAKLKRFTESREVLEKAANICNDLGDKMRAGEAYAVMVEDLPLEYREALLFFLRADELLADRKRILSLGIKVGRLIEPSLLKTALENANGSVTKAAESLGIYHSLLITRIERLTELKQYRKPVRVRRWKKKPYKVLSNNKASLDEKTYKDSNSKSAK